MPQKSFPSWVYTLQTASIRADMIAADAGATVTYSGLEKLIVDLDSLLASSSTGLTSAELSDLKTIAANLNNGMYTSSYLTTIFSDLVNGNAANATWTGGNSLSTSLGNLAVGFSVTQLAELNCKWFLGSDLPGSQVVVDTSGGQEKFSVWYAPAPQPLFGPTGPSMNDINQGHLNDCYLLASLAEVANHNPNIISSMFTSNGNNTYGVRFYVNGVANYVTVNNELADGGSEFNKSYGTDIWASLAEKAYAQLQTGGVVTGDSSFQVTYGTSWSNIGKHGGDVRYALEEITGATQITEFSATGNFWGTGNTFWSSAVYNQSFQAIGGSYVNSTAAVQSTLIADLQAGDDLVLSSNTNAYDSHGKLTLVADHAMSIYGFDNASGMFEVRNPWGTTDGTFDTTFEVSLATLLKDGDVITADNMGNGAFGPHTNPQPPLPGWGGPGATNTLLTWGGPGGTGTPIGNIVNPNPGDTHIIPTVGATVAQAGDHGGATVDGHSGGTSDSSAGTTVMLADLAHNPASMNGPAVMLDHGNHLLDTGHQAAATTDAGHSDYAAGPHFELPTLHTSELLVHH